MNAVVGRAAAAIKVVEAATSSLIVIGFTSDWIDIFQLLVRQGTMALPHDSDLLEDDPADALIVNVNSFRCCGTSFDPDVRN